jgi:RNA polymerase sigma-70 factor (ECF subfamily)
MSVAIAAADRRLAIVIAWLVGGDALVSGRMSAGATRLELVERARSGDPDAFEALIRAVGDHLLAVARKILRDPDAAEDALQSAVIRGWRSLPRLRDPARFDQWLYRILVMSCYAEANRRRRVAGEVRLLATEPADNDPFGAIADRDVLEKAFKALTPNHRAIVVLHFFADLPLAEVADVLGINHGTARSRLHYALRAMRSALDALDRGSRGGAR